jgi:hypothetical protein
MVSKRSYSLTGANGMVADLERCCKVEFTPHSHVARWDDPAFGSAAARRTSVLHKKQVALGPLEAPYINCSGHLGVPVFMKSDPTNADQEYDTAVLNTTVHGVESAQGFQFTPSRSCAAHQRIVCSEGQSAEQCVEATAKMSSLQYGLSRYATQLHIVHKGNYSFSATAAYNMGYRIFIWVDEKLMQPPSTPGTGYPIPIASVVNSSLLWLDAGWHSLRIEFVREHMQNSDLVLRWQAHGPELVEPQDIIPAHMFYHRS